MNKEEKLSEEDITRLEESLHVKGLISPQKERILGLTDDLLLQHYGLIAHKGSSLSSAERQMVFERVAYAIQSKRMTMEQVTDAVNHVTKAIENEIKRTTLLNDTSKTKEQE